MLEEVRSTGATVYDGEAAIALRAIEAGARETRSRADGGPTAYLALMGRLLQVNKARPGRPSGCGPTRQLDRPPVKLL